MDGLFLKMWLRSLINEEINKDQLTSVANALNKSEEYLRHWVIRTDPTSNQGFSVWLLRGLKKEWIRMEDGPRAREALERFILLRRQNRIADIMQFPRINDLEDEIDRIAVDTSKTQGQKVSGLDPTRLPGVSILESRPQQGITLYKVANAKSLATIGEGTKWCTRWSYRHTDDIAQSYIKRFGYLVVGFKNGKPFIQFNPDYSQVMDVNDLSFRDSRDVNPRDLELPPPEFLSRPLSKLTSPVSKMKFIRPVEPKRGETSALTPQQQHLKNWMSFTHKKNPEWDEFIKPRVGYSSQRTASTKGRDLDYEQRLAKSILKTQNHDFFARMMEGFREYAQNELGAGHRSEIVEKALLDKNFADIQQNYGYIYRNGKKIRQKRSGISGLHSIAEYVRNNIQGNWPEFEKKLANDPYNSIRYYNVAEVNPIYVDNPLTKDVILFSRMIEEGKPTVSKEEFNATLKDFLVRARAQFKHSNFSIIVSRVIEPYLKKTNQSVQEALGKDIAQILRMSTFVGYGTQFWNRKPNANMPRPQYINPNIGH